MTIIYDLKGIYKLHTKKVGTVIITPYLSGKAFPKVIG